MEQNNKTKATAEDLKTYYEFEERMKTLSESGDKREWEETAKAADDFIESRDWFTIIIEKDGKEGIMDLDGTVLVPPIFDKVVYTYSRILMKADKPAVVINNGKYGLVRPDGTREMVLPCEHDCIRIADVPNYFFVTDNGKTMIVSNSGKQLTPQMLDKFYGTTNGIIPVAAKGKLGLFDTSSGLFVEPAYDDIEIEFDQPVIAYRDGVPGYLSAEDGHFLPKDPYDNSDDVEELVMCY